MLYDKWNERRIHRMRWEHRLWLNLILTAVLDGIREEEALEPEE